MVDSIKGSTRLAGVVILAGGASTRMGTPKAELVLPAGERLLDYHVRHALDLVRANVVHGKKLPIMIADNGRGFDVDSALKNSHPQDSIMHITDYASVDADVDANANDKNSNDKVKTGGALVAIESALQTLTHLKQVEQLQHYTSSWLLVISCDSLIPATDLWQKLQPVATQITTSQSTDKKVICLTDDSHLYPLLGLYQLSLEPDLKVYIDSGARRVMPFIKPNVQAVSFTNNWQYLTNFNTPKDFEQACHSLSTLSMSDYKYQRNPL
nr:NTP transferase domain-containing protein [uncultured Psychrobacter sp.]